MIRDRLAAALVRPAPALLSGDFDPGDAAMAEGMPAAVLVTVVDRRDPTLLLTRRAETLRRHAGQVAFPGGRIDPGDDGPVAAALREAEEEIGLPRDRVQVIGVTDRYVTGTGFAIVPVVGIVPPDLPLVPHEDEVAELFEVPLDFAVDAANQVALTGEWRGQTRHYYEIVWQDRRIWGATAAMIVNLGRRLADG
jgi:8-oxo-dGTP pyrophosphatase MutT (NUDIX family)